MVVKKGVSPGPKIQLSVLVTLSDISRCARFSRVVCCWSGEKVVSKYSRCCNVGEMHSVNGKRFTGRECVTGVCDRVRNGALFVHTL